MTQRAPVGPKAMGLVLGALALGVAGVVLAPSGVAPAMAAETEGAANATAAAASTDAATTADPARIEAYLADIRAEATRRGLSAATVDRALAGFAPDPDIIALLRDQPEHARSVGTYLGFAASDKRIAEGRAKLAEEKERLDAIEKTYGVDRHVVVAIWGLESTYGTGMGTRSVVRSLATLALDGGRRAGFGRNQLFAALEILERGDIAADAMVGSWAGAMGHTQFIPTTFNAYAVDFDGDGRRDVWGNVGDALASTANYLKASGWETGRPWGFEVALPADFDFARSGRRKPRPLAEWADAGLTRADGRPLVADLGTDAAAWPGAVILPSGAKGPAFIVLQNFRAILRYNQAVSYALGIGHLSDRLAGGAPFRTPWPEDDVPLNRSEREELQSLLVARGLSTGGIDGIIGPATRDAVRTVQVELGVPADGHPNAALLERLRADTPSAPKEDGDG